MENTPKQPLPMFERTPLPRSPTADFHRGVSPSSTSEVHHETDAPSDAFDMARQSINEFRSIRSFLSDPRRQTSNPKLRKVNTNRAIFDRITQETTSEIQKLEEQLKQTQLTSKPPLTLGPHTASEYLEDYSPLPDSSREENIDRKRAWVEMHIQTYLKREQANRDDGVVDKKRMDKKTSKLKACGQSLEKFLPSPFGSISLMVEFTEEDEEDWEECLDGAPMEVLVSNFSVDVKRADFRTLMPLAWLNDEIINQYMMLLKQRSLEFHEQDPSLKPCYFQSSFFYTKLSEGGKYNYSNVRRWTARGPGKVDLFSQSKAFYPINVAQTHWCLCVVYIEEQRIVYYDSMGGAGTTVLEHMFKYLQDEHMNKKKEPLNVDGWELESPGNGVPQQDNCSDCGVFLCQFANHISIEQPLDFTAADMPYFRQRIGLDILNKGVSMEDDS